MKRVAFVACFCVLAAIPATLKADTIFTDRVSFDAALGASAIIQGWDTLPNGALITVLDGITYVPGDGGTALVTDAFTPLSPPNTLGDNTVGFFGAGVSMTFIFPSPITAFGISFNTFDTSPGGYLLTTNTGSTAPSAFDPFPGDVTGEFAGLIATSAFTSVTITNPGGFTYTLDNLTYNAPTAIPEPATFWLWATALVGSSLLLAFRRRQPAS